MDEARALELKEEVRRGWTDESAGWVKNAELIEAWTRDATGVMLAAARPAPGMRVLDLACGIGDTAIAMARAVAPAGSVVAADLVDEMVLGAERFARARGVKNVTFRQADAESLPFDDASFDVVTCRHGVMFFPQAQKAMREARRVLRPDGRVVLLAWGPVERNPFFLTLSGPFLSRMGAQPPGSDDLPGPFRFSASGSLSKVLYAAGFEDVQESTREIAWDFPGTPETFWTVVQEVSSSAFDWFRESLEPRAFEEAAAEVRAAVAARSDGDRVPFRATMVLATARAP